MLLKNVFKKFVFRIYEAASKKLYDEVHATRELSMLSSLIVNWTYLPFTDWAAGPEYYAHICNDIIINRKQSIVEVGSGISTIILARLIKKNNINAKFISIDQSAEWQSVVEQNLESDGIRDVVEFIHTPVVQTDNYVWYDTSRMSFAKDFFVDTLIVDGPIGEIAPGVRYEAVPYFKKFLSKNCYTIYLHDIDRNEEFKISRDWSVLLPNTQVEYHNRYAVWKYGTVFCFSPQSVV